MSGFLRRMDFLVGWAKWIGLGYEGCGVLEGSFVGGSGLMGLLWCKAGLVWEMGRCEERGFGK